MNAEHATPPLDDNTLTLRKEDLEDLLDRAAEKGAERALVHLGLEGPHAAQDIRELRDLLEAWRDARRTAWRTVIRVATTSLLVVALLGAAIKFKFMGGSQ
jgi:predicted aconitase